jgi:putative glutamine amidotransferase
MIVGVTDNRVNEAKYALYEEWLREGRPAAGIIRLTPGDANARELSRCDGLVLTGGGDVDPVLYGADGAHQTLYEISNERDRFEAALVKESLLAGRPVLGICRGMQLVNVVLGGTLITDLVEAGHPPHGTVNGVKCRHEVLLDPACAMGRLLGVERGWVASSHHQAVDRIGEGLTISARSGDGVVEALELPRPRGGFDILLVQWHPERMGGEDPALSAGLRTLFFDSLTTT